MWGLNLSLDKHSAIFEAKESRERTSDAWYGCTPTVVFIWGEERGEGGEAGEESKVFRTSTILSLSSRVEAGLKKATIFAALVDSWDKRVDKGGISA
jgi:hypothetical protein